MREIKFRAWLKNEKLMFNPDGDYRHMGLTSPVFFISPNGKIIAGNQFPVEDLVLMQYTGLKDKNGKEIYEGDIIKLGFTTQEIKWVDQGFATVDPKGGIFELCGGRITLIEVIGNIYETPELFPK